MEHIINRWIDRLIAWRFVRWLVAAPTYRHRALAREAGLKLERLLGNRAYTSGGSGAWLEKMGSDRKVFQAFGFQEAVELQEFRSGGLQELGEVQR